MSQTLVDQFHKNSAEIVKVQLQEYKGQVYVDSRIWLLDIPASNGAERPTHKGLTLSADLLPQFINALQAAREALEREG